MVTGLRRMVGYVLYGVLVLLLLILLMVTGIKCTAVNIFIFIRTPFV